MSDPLQTLMEALQQRFADQLQSCTRRFGQLTIEVDPAQALEVFTTLRDDPAFAFEQLMDICGVDYSAHGLDEWTTVEATGQGYSRGVDPTSPGRGPDIVGRLGQSNIPRRFAAVYHLLSLAHNQRLRVRVYAPDDELPVVPSVNEIWSSANWFEREAFDLFGIIFEGHPDLRRLLTDYGFVGHPFRKDFPLIGNVEMRYDPEKGRVIYQPVSIEPRVLVPRVIRTDNRYVERAAEEGEADA